MGFLVVVLFLECLSLGGLILISCIVFVFTSRATYSLSISYPFHIIIHTFTYYLLNIDLFFFCRHFYLSFWSEYIRVYTVSGDSGPGSS